MFPVKIVESFVRGVTYKPSWTFRVEQIVDEIAIIVVQFYAPDSDVKWAPHYDGTGAMISTGYTMDLGGVRDMDDLARVFLPRHHHASGNARKPRVLQRRGNGVRQACAPAHH
jgi:hypothetical protein